MKAKLIKIVGGIALGVALLVLALPTIVHKAGLHPEYNGEAVQLPAGKRALIIATNQAVLSAPGETTGDATGVMASEMTHPYYRFLDAGMQVDLASIKGGKIPVDPQTINRLLKTPEDDRFLADPAFLAKVENSMGIADVDFTQYDIIFMAGGFGHEFRPSAIQPGLAEKVSEAYYASNEPVIGGVCHGVLGLINAKDRDGKSLIAGRRMTGVTDKQIKELGIIEITPQHPETELRKAGVIFESNTRIMDFLATLVVVDEEGRFVTGQNQNSGRETAHRMLELVASKSTK